MEEENLNLDAMQMSETQFIDKYCVPLHNGENYINNILHNPEDESNSTRNESIGQVLAQIYGQLLAIVAVISVFTEVLHGPVPLFQLHVYIYLYLIGVSLFIFVWSFMNRLNHKFNGKKNYPEIWKTHLNPHLFLMFGLIAFGAAIFTSALLKSFAAINAGTCLNSQSSALYVTNTIFAVLQVHFFCAKNFNYIMSSVKNFSVIHLIATNVALWIYSVLWESSADWQDMLHLKHNSSLVWGKNLNISLHSIESDLKPSNGSHFPKHVIHFTRNCWWQIIPESEVSVDISSVNVCLQSTSVGIIWKKVSEYIYPFMIQYYIIIIFLLYDVYKNLTSTNEKSFLSAHLVRIKESKNCFCISKGFYLGCLYLIASITIVILYSIVSIENFNVVVLSMLSIIYTSAVFAIVVGLCQLKSETVHWTLLNNFYFALFEIGTYSVYVLGIVNLYAGSIFGEKYASLLLIIEALLMILHGVSQYIFMKSIIKSRRVVDFLIACNASLWVLETFVFCCVTTSDVQLKVYGVAWPVMCRIIVPCLAFFRFTSVLLLYDASKYLSAEFTNIIR